MQSEGCSEDDWVCYSANCEVEECYGGWGIAKPVSDPGGTSPPPSDPAMWRVRILDAEIPPHNLTIEWDADGSAPDPFAVVTIGSPTAAAYQTSAIQDTYTPAWSESPAPPSTEASLKNFLWIDVVDEDIAVDDPVGGCPVVLSDADFTGDVVPVACPATSARAGFVAHIALDPVP